MRATLLLARAAVLVVLVIAPAAQAVPAFARRYGTSCQTCHVAFPKNTPFGEAFRRNGHHFPGGDEDVRREEPMKLGADANRDVFPNAVWPGELPFTVPLSAMLNSNVMFSAASEEKVSFAGVGATIGLNVAAAFGERISGWIGLSFMGSSAPSVAVDIERAFVTLSLFSKPWANVRIGRFEPGVLSFSMHRTLGTVPWLFTSTIGDNPSTLEPTQLGAEVTGVLAGRGAYSVGLVEGQGRLNLPKNVYGRLAWKFGGLRLDGETQGDDDQSANPAPWREWSLQAGAFGYLGVTSLGTPQTAAQDDRFFVVGGDLNALLGDANLVVAYTFTRNNRPMLAAPQMSVSSHQVYAQLDYVVLPWLVPLARVEWRVLTGSPQERFSVGLYLLARANVRVLLLASATHTTGSVLTFDQAQAGLALGF